MNLRGDGEASNPYDKQLALKHLRRVEIVSDLGMHGADLTR